MKALLDTNIVTKVIDSANPQHSLIQKILDELRKNGHFIGLVPLVL